MSEPTQSPAVIVERLGKRYGRLRAVDGLDLAVETGETFGFLGLNGAGKTTTIKILLDLRRPTAGRAAILGHDCQRQHRAARRLVGLSPRRARLLRRLDRPRRARPARRPVGAGSTPTTVRHSSSASSCPITICRNVCATTAPG